MNRFSSFALTLVLTLAVSRHAAAQDQDLLLRLGLSKHQYVVSEPVFLRTSLINTGDSAISVRRLYLPHGYFNIVINNSSGKTFPLAYEATTARDSTRSVKLEPHDSASIVIDLLPLYAEGEQILRKMHTKTFFDPGSYTVRATFETGHGKTVSRAVRFSVAAPQGAERRVCDLLVRAAKFQLDQQEAPAASTLDSIIRNSPKSAYHVQAFLQKMYLYEYKETPEAQRKACATALALIDTHPASEATIPALSYFMIHSDQIGKTPKDIRKTLSSILRKHPDTRIAKEAYRALKLYHSDE